MGLGNFLSGFAAARDARKATPAQGVGGTPVTPTGKPVEADYAGPSEGPASGSTLAPTKTLGQKITSGLKTGLKNILGFKKGGRITKSGIAFLHKGESIIPASKERKPLRMSARRSSRR